MKKHWTIFSFLQIGWILLKPAVAIVRLPICSIVSASIQLILAVLSFELHGMAAEPRGASREHWAYQPVRRPQISNSVETSSSPSINPIDAFLDRGLNGKRIQPANAAKPEVILRRLHLDLVGVPPTKEELDEFLKDSSEYAYERVVERLLRDPRHGERWGRHWMDVWRYSDWFGRRMVPDVWNSAPQIWRWRDWIVRSVNADKGYDRMITEMLAGDEVSPDDPEVAVATGFLVRNWYALNPNEWMRANVEHTSKAFLGLTFHCAHCHDHKYDPISQDDYFSLRAFFEPIYVRQDRWVGESDPGMFQDYDYSVTRKVQRLGSVRVFDKHPNAVTWHYTDGDERNRLTNRESAKPSMPGFLGVRPARIEPVKLPLTSTHPALRAEIYATELAERNRAIASATSSFHTFLKTNHHAQLRKENEPGPFEMMDLRLQSLNLKQVASELQLTSLEARYAADRAQLDESGNRRELMIKAARSEHEALVAQAVAKVKEQEVLLADSQMTLANDVSKTDPVKMASKALEDARKAMHALRTKSEAPSDTNTVEYTSIGPVYPETSTGRRRALAAWIVARENPLTARVAVNHIWTRHFHEPLVRSMTDFGMSTPAPLHGDLLDWLAVEFMESGWSMKRLHRLIVTSRAYRRSSAPLPEQTKSDPENLYYWRMNTGRMEAEVVRDTILFLSRELDLRMGGQELENKDAETTGRRSVYYSYNPESDGRSEFSALFDAPDANECYRRSRSLVPQQALAMTNSRLVHRNASRIAEFAIAAFENSNKPTQQTPIFGRSTKQTSFNEVESEENAREPWIVNYLFRSILSRPPSAEELKLCLKFLDGTKQPSASDKLSRAVQSLARVILNHNDFVMIR